MAETMRGLLYAVTQKGGTAQKLSIPGYTFAGKTGTAQKVDPVTRHYSPDRSGRRRSWASRPRRTARLVLFVMIDEPQGSHHGSDVAGPIWQDVMVDSLRWLGRAADGADGHRPNDKADKSDDGKPVRKPPADAGGGHRGRRRRTDERGAGVRRR